MQAVAVVISILLLGGALEISAPETRENGGPVATENMGRCYKKYQYWVEKYKLFAPQRSQLSRFLFRVAYRSNHTYPHIQVPTWYAASGATVVHSYSFSYNLYGANQLMPFQIANNILLLTFANGVKTTVHLLIPSTGEYRSIKLGGDSLRYFLEVPAGVYHSVDIEHDPYTFIGMTVVVVSNEEPVFQFGDLDELLALFPDHSSIINHLYNRAPGYDQYEEI